MVATADGQGRIGDNTAELGGAGDAASLCDAARTRRLRDGRHRHDRRRELQRAGRERPRCRQRRDAAGLAPRPLFATITRSGRAADGGADLRRRGLQVVVFSEAELELSSVARARSTQIATTDPGGDSAARSATSTACARVLLEGGPHINTPFFARELVDELFLTIAPMLIGGADPFPIIAGPLPGPQQLHLISALSGDEHLFLRYRVD